MSAEGRPANESREFTAGFKQGVREGRAQALAEVLEAIAAEKVNRFDPRQSTEGALALAKVAQAVRQLGELGKQ